MQRVNFAIDLLVLVLVVGLLAICYNVMLISQTESQDIVLPLLSTILHFNNYNL